MGKQQYSQEIQDNTGKHRGLGLARCGFFLFYFAISFLSLSICLLKTFKKKLFINCDPF